MRSLAARCLALLTALAVSLPMTAFGRTTYFCRMMNRVVATCCCAADARHEAVRETRVRAEDCCEKLAPRAQAASLRAAASNVDVPPAARLETTALVAYVAPQRDTLPAPSIRARAPPALGPPLFIVHCALLT
jgi:hypothetical protein